MPRLLLVILLVTLLTSAATIGAAFETTPLADPVPGAPWSLKHLAQQGVVLEAAIKARSAEAGARALALATPGMDDYDVTWYDLVLDLDPGGQQLSGTTTVRAEVTGASLEIVDLNLNLNMVVSEVRGAAGTLATTRAGDVLSVTLERPYLQGEFFTLEIDYGGNPAGDYFGWATYGGQPLIWTLAEPFGARDWWVCKDLNTDKADSVDLHVTVPDPLYVASVGRLDATTVPEAGRSTFHWKHRYPIATYLVSLAIHPYDVITDEYQPMVGDPMPVLHYVIPDWAADAELGYAVTPAMITAFAAVFGEYPFVDEKYGHAHFPWGGGMEHQTCSSMLYWYYGEGIIAHELGHQWFGDMITCADFHHIWLNEGFARWIEAYWLEYSVGVQAYRDRMEAVKYVGAGTVFVEDTSDFADIFDLDLTYNKASWVVHRLRGVLGDEDFFAGLAAYRSQFEFASATTEDLQQAIEGATGRDLSTFFQQWIYGDGAPVYDLSWTNVPQTGGGGRVTVRVAQVQNGALLFAMPLEIRIMTDQGVDSHVIDNAEAVEWHVFDVAGVPSNVELDPDGWVLCTVQDQAVSGVPTAGAAVARITGNAPNPFNPSTTIAFDLATPTVVEIVIYDASGRRVRALLDELRPAGGQKTVWDGRDGGGRSVATGVYFARLRADGHEDFHKMTLVK